MDESESLPWSAEVDSGPAGQWQRVRWHMTGAGLQAALETRGPQRDARLLDSEQRLLLLSDMVLAGDSLLALSLLLGRDPQAPGRLRLEAVVTVEKAVGEGLTATLVWGDDHYRCPLEGNRVVFGGLPPPEAGQGLGLTLARGA